MTSMDWHFVGAATRLARTIFYERVEAFELSDEKTWEVQPAYVKDAYIDKAAELLEGLKPASVTQRLDYLEFAKAITRQHAATVIGRISPSEPYGVAPSDERKAI